jgi:hypothetical protein
MEPVENLIHLIRGQRVILDADLAWVYGVPTKQLNQAVKRNNERFPDDFAFELEPQEVAALRSQVVTSKGRGGRRYVPIAFTEHGAIMAANVPNSPRAVQMSVFVVRSFIKMRETLGENRHLAEKLAELERRLTGRLVFTSKPSSTSLTKLKSSWSRYHPSRNRNAGKLDFMFGMKPQQSFVAVGMTSLRQKKVRASSRQLLH